MRVIAHRGNLIGPNPERENTYSYIQEALDAGYDVEVDIWYKDGYLYAGHDEPKEEFPLDVLMDERVWTHAKTVETFQYLVDFKKINVFFQDNDEMSLTSRGYIWLHSNTKSLGSKKTVHTNLDGDGSFGHIICTDQAVLFENEKKTTLFRVLAIDVDGVLAKTKVYERDGNAKYKEFCDKDWTAIKRFKSNNIDVCFVSGDIWNKGIAYQRNIDFFHTSSKFGSLEKAHEVENICKKYSVSPDEIAYIGDDYYDIGLMNKVGLAICPAKSPKDVQESCDIILSSTGGEGCIAELYDMFRDRLVDCYPYDDL